MFATQSWQTKAHRHLCPATTLLLVSQVVYGADKQSWASIRTALRKGEAKDGTVTLVLERRVTPDSAAATPAASGGIAAASSSSS